MSHASFERRLRRLIRKHRRLAAGIVYRMAPDGLVTAHPGPRPATAPRLPLKGIALLGAFALCFKALLFAALGEPTYVARLDALADGSVAERAGATLMRPDPLTRALASLVPVP